MNRQELSYVKIVVRSAKLARSYGSVIFRSLKDRTNEYSNERINSYLSLQVGRLFDPGYPQCCPVHPGYYLPHPGPD